MLGVAGTSLLATPGCVFLLMRLFVGRGATGVLTRARMAGGARLGATFGRGVAVGSAATRAAVARSGGTVTTVPKANIIGSNNTVIASTRSTKSGIYTTMKGSDVLYSRRTRYGYDHEVQTGSAGRSYDRGDYIEYKNSRGQTTAFDRVRLSKNLIEHFDQNQELIGSTQLEQNQDELHLHSDEDVVKAFEALEEALGLDCPDARAAYDEWTISQEACQTGTGPCGANAARYQHYEERARACIKTRD